MSSPQSPATTMVRKATTLANGGGSAVGPVGKSVRSSGSGTRRSYAPAVRALVVLPTYQEADNIAEVLRRLRAAAPAVDVLVVDDSSPDGTAAIAEAVGHELGGIDVMVRATKSGLGSAYRAGFAEGLARGYDVLVEMDSDLSHDPARLPGLVAAVAGGGQSGTVAGAGGGNSDSVAVEGRADLAIGSRYVPGGSIPDWPFHRRLLSRWGNHYADFVLGLSVRDVTSGFRAYRAATLRSIDLDSVSADGYGFQIEMAYRVARNGGTIVELPIEFVDRARGTSKMSFRIIAEAMGLVGWWGVRDRVLHHGGYRTARSHTVPPVARTRASGVMAKL